MAFGVKIKLGVSTTNSAQLRREIQKAVDDTLANSPVVLRNFQVDISAQKKHEMVSSLQKALADSELTVTVGKFDASKPIEDLRKQLTTMLSGLSITGLKEFLGTEGIEETYNKAAAAANKLAEAQENVRRKAAATNAELQVLRTLQSQLNSISKTAMKVKDADSMASYLDKYRELTQVISRARSLQGEAQEEAVAGITQTVAVLQKEVSAQLEAEKAAARKAEAEKAAAQQQVESSYRIAAEEARAEAAKQRQIDAAWEAEKARIAKEEAAANALAQRQIDAWKKSEDARVRSEERAGAAAEKAAIREQNNIRKVLQLRREIEEYRDKNPKVYTNYQTTIDAFLAKLKNEATVTDEMLAEIRRELEGIKETADSAGIAGQTFFDKLKAGWEKFGNWSIVTKSMMAAVKTVRAMITNVVALDDAMTELKKVTDLTNEGYNKFGKTASTVAKRVGATISDTVNATADFARLGYSVGDATQLAEAALVYKNVGDGIDDISEATESLISSIKAFGLEANDAMSIIDKFNEVGNNFAISSSGIGEALQRSASALAAAGNTIDESIGLVAAMNSVVQNPEQVGTALKTLTMYLRAAKTEAEDAGIETDGMAESVSKLRDELLSLTGVDIMLDESTFKSTYQIMKEMADIWEELSDVTQANVLNLLGGKRNANVISAVLTNFADAEKAAQTAMTAMGSAVAENEKYLNSITGKLSILKAQFEDLSSGIINSDLIKWIVDVGSALLSGLNWLRQIHALLPAITSAVITIRGAMNGWKATDTLKSIIGAIGQNGTSNTLSKTTLGAITNALNGLNDAQKKVVLSQLNAAVSTGALTKEYASQIINLTSLSKVTGNAGTSVSRFKTIISGITASFKSWQGWLVIIEIAYGLIRNAIDLYNQKIQESIDKAKEIISVFSEAQKTYKSNATTLDGLKNQFNKLSAGVDENGRNVSLTASEYKDYLSIIEKIIDISPDVVKGYDDEGYAIMNYKGALDEAIASQETYINNQRAIYLGSGKDLFEGKTNEYKQAQQLLGKAGSKLGDVLTPAAWWDTKGMDQQVSAWRAALKELGMELDLSETWGTAYADLEKIYNNASKFMTLLKNSGAYTVDQLNDIQTAIYGLSGSLTQLNSIEAEQINYTMEWAKDKDWYAALPITALDELRSGFIDVLDPLKSYTENMQQAEAFGAEFSAAIGSESVQKLIELSKGLSDGSISVEAYNAAVKEYLDSFEGSGAVLTQLTAILYGFSDAAVTVTDSITAMNELTKDDPFGLSSMASSLNGINSKAKTLLDTIRQIEDGSALLPGEFAKLAQQYFDLELNWSAFDLTTAEGQVEALRNALAGLDDEYDHIIDGYIAAIETAREVESDDVTLKYLDSLLSYLNALKDFNLDELNPVIKEEKGLFETMRDAAKATAENAALLAQAQRESADTGLSEETINKLYDLFGEDSIKYYRSDLSGAFRLAGDELERQVDLMRQETEESLHLNELKAAANDILAETSKRQTELGEQWERGEITSAEYLDAYLNAYQEMLDKGSGWYTWLGLLELFSEKTEEAFDTTPITNAISAIQKANKVLTSLESGDYDVLSMIETATEMAADSGKELSEFFTYADGAFTFNKQTVKEWACSYIDSISETLGITEEMKDAWKDFIQAEMDDPLYTSTLVSNLDSINSRASTLIDSLRGVREGTALTADEILKLTLNYPELAQVWSDFDMTTAEGQVQALSHALLSLDQAYDAAIDDWIQKIDDALATADEGRRQELANLKQFLIDLKGMTLENLNPAAEEATVTLADMIEMIEVAQKRTDLIKQVNEELAKNGKLSLETARQIEELFGTDYIHTVGANLTADVDALQKRAEALEANIEAELGIKDLDEKYRDLATRYMNDEMTPAEYVDAFEKLGKAEQEADERLWLYRAAVLAAKEALDTDAVPSITDATSAIEKANSAITALENGDVDVLSMIDTLTSMAEDSGKSLEEFFTYSDGAFTFNKQAIKDWAYSYIDKLSETEGITEEMRQALRDLVKAEIEAKTAAEQMAETYDTVKGAMGVEGSFGGYTQLTYEGFKSLIDIDRRYAAAIEYQNGVLVLNSDKHAETTRQILEETKAAAELEKQNILLSKEYKDLVDAFKSGTIDYNGLKRLSDLELQIQGYNVLTHEIDSATSAYSRWINRKGDSGMDRYSQAVQAFKLINDTLNDAESEYYGRIGREEFGQAVDFVIGEHVEVDTDEFKRGMELAKRYLTEGAEGAANFYDDLVKHGIIDSTTGAMNASLEEISDALGLSEEMVRTMIDRLNEYQKEENKIKVTGPEVDADETESLLSQVVQSLEDAQGMLEDLNNTPLDIKTGGTDSRLKSTLSYLSQIASKVAAINKTSATISTTTSSSTSTPTLYQRFMSLIGRSSAGGTAMAAGGRTLVGELGREIVVDPATNRWYTVGDQGAEFVDLPQNAIVFNHLQTKQLLGGGSTTRGAAMAGGAAAAWSLGSIISDAVTAVGTAVGSGIKAVTNFLTGKTTTSSSGGDSAKGTPVAVKSSGGSTGSSSGSSSGGSSSIKSVTNDLEDLNKQLEHLIEHQVHLYNVAEHGLNYSGMFDSLAEQARIYRMMMVNAQEAVSKMIAEGADDTNEELQQLEEAAWSAYNNMNSVLDQMNTLYVDALNNKIDGIQTAYSNLEAAAEEFNNFGGVTVDTFQKLIENGVQYLSLLENENGQFVINREDIEKLIAAEKEQLAIEQALSYILQLKTALENGEANAVVNLVDLTNSLSSSTWDVVYAQAALLKNAGLTDAQFARVIKNIDALKAISSGVITDITESSETAKESYDDSIDALDAILKKTQELIKYETNEHINAIKDEIDAYKKIISLKKESLKTTKDEDDYAKSVAEKTQEIAELQAKIDLLALDDSRQAQAQRAALIEDLKKKQEDLNELQGDHAYDLQIEALDKLADEYEEVKQDEIDALEQSISSAEKLYQAAMQRLDSSWDTIYQDLIAWNTEAGTSLNSEITENWKKAAEAVQLYGSYVAAVSNLNALQEGSHTSDGTSGNGIVSNVVANGNLSNVAALSDQGAAAAAAAAAEQAAAAQAAAQAPAAQEEAPKQETIKKLRVVDGNWYVRTGAGQSNQSIGVAKQGQEFEYTGSSSGGWYQIWFKGQKGWIYGSGSKIVTGVKTYHDGGTVGEAGSINDNEVLAILKKKELVVPEKSKNMLYKIIDFQEALSAKLGTMIGKIGSPLPQLTPALASGIGSGLVGGNNISYSPVFNVTVSYDSDATGSEARRFGEQIAETAMDRLYEGFMRRGVNGVFGAKLKQ